MKKGVKKPCKDGEKDRAFKRVDGDRERCKRHTRRKRQKGRTKIENKRVGRKENRE